MALWSKPTPQEDIPAELREWGEKVAACYDELPPATRTPKPDDVILVPIRVRAPQQPRTTNGRVHKNRIGAVMPCIVCGEELTLDGKFCAAHAHLGM